MLPGVSVQVMGGVSTVCVSKVEGGDLVNLQNLLNHHPPLKHQPLLY